MELSQTVLAQLCAKHDIDRLLVFGSVARGDETLDSDIDLIAHFAEPQSLFELVGIEIEFSEALGRKVDLLTEAALSPYIRDSVLSEAKVPLKEPPDFLYLAHIRDAARTIG